MSRKLSLRWLCIIFAACIVIGTVVGLVCAQLIALQEYHQAAQLSGVFSKINPQLQDILMQALKDEYEADAAAGDAVLRQYSYSPGVFWSRNAASMIFAGIMLMLIPAALLVIASNHLYNKHQSRINELTAYLEAVNLGRDRLLVRQEDDFSHLEDEIYKAVTELRESRKNALRERQSLADNLADISHQLKTPITSMSLMIQLLADNCYGEDAVYTEKLERQLNRLETLVSSLLTLSKLDAGTIQFKCESMDIYAMLTRAAEPIEDAIIQNKQKLVIQSQPEAYISGDIGWTVEAFLNLIKNCSEHTPDGGTITISYTKNPIYTEIIVEDSGEGFDKDDIPHLFERFYKGKNTKKDSIGIGLALSKAIITRQNGTIEAENATEGGARFVIKFYYLSPECHFRLIS